MTDNKLIWNFTDTLTIMWRNLIHYRRQPQLLAFSTIQPVMFVLLFTYVFGGAINAPGGDYINYLLPGILVQTVVFGGTATSIGLADDLQRGLVDRFRSLPMARSAVLAGRTLADTVRNIFVIMLMVIVGYLNGFSYQGSFAEFLGGIAVLIVFGHVMSWIFALTGVVLKDAETAQTAGFVFVFPLVFASSIFVPIETMPSWLETFATYQPISVTATTVRALFFGAPVEDFGLWLFWMVAIFSVFVPLAIRQYRRSAN